MINTKNKYILLLSLLSIIGCGNPDLENENPEPIEQVDPRAADKAEIIKYFMAMGFGFDEDPAEVKKLLDDFQNYSFFQSIHLNLSALVLLFLFH